MFRKSYAPENGQFNLPRLVSHINQQYEDNLGHSVEGHEPVSLHESGQKTENFAGPHFVINYASAFVAEKLNALLTEKVGNIEVRQRSGAMMYGVEKCKLASLCYKDEQTFLFNLNKAFKNGDANDEFAALQPKSPSNRHNH